MQTDGSWFNTGLPLILKFSLIPIQPEDFLKTVPISQWIPWMRHTNARLVVDAKLEQRRFQSPRVVPNGTRR